MIFTMVVLSLVLGPIVGFVVFLVENHFDKKSYQTQIKEDWERWEIENDVVLSKDNEDLRAEQINHVLNW